MKRFLKFHGPAIFWAVLIFIASSIPKLPAPDLKIPLMDKWIHLVVYGIFGCFLQRSFLVLSPNRIFVFGMTFLVGSVYGLSDEFHQSFVPGREACVGDFIADTLGVSLSFLAYRLVLRFQQN